MVVPADTPPATTHAQPGHRLSLVCLGACGVTVHGAPVTNFRSQKALALLIYLAVEADYPHRRERLAGLLWPDSDEEAARHSLRQVLSNLRHALHDTEADPSHLIMTRDAVQFNRASNHWLDLAEFTKLLYSCQHHHHRRVQTCKPCIQRLEQAVALYRGDFLQQFFVSDSAEFEEWATIKREQLQRRALEALGQLAGAYEHCDANDKARGAIWRQVELAPWYEEAYRHLMHLDCLLQQPSAALTVYESCRRALAGALAVEPSAETTALYEQIRAGTYPAPTPSARHGPHNLPAQMNGFVGRETELAALGDLISDPAHRLIVLTGTGGVGKTRLALQAALDHRASFADGVFMVSLSPLEASNLVETTIAQTLGIHEGGTEPVLARLKVYLAGKQLLLLLDNFEHVIAAAPVVSELLMAAPDLEVLVTSREPLHLYGEHEFPVLPLVVPACTDNVLRNDPKVVIEHSAVRLFVQRASAVKPDFQLTEANAAAVGELCARLDGLPLAIELAAARVKLFTSQAMLERLDQRLDWLTAGPRNRPARQRTLRATIDWSYSLLEPVEKLLFSRLAVFTGGWTLDGATAVCQDEYRSHQILDGVASLLDKGLVLRMDGGDAAPRFTMLETVREFALERLADTSLEEVIRRRHAQFYLELAERSEPCLRGEEQSTWLQRLEEEHDNLRVALRWALDHDVANIGLPLVGSLRWFWTLRSHVNEGYEWARVMLEQSEAGRATVARAKALWTAGVMAWFQQDPVARDLLEESVAAWRREGGEERGLGYALQHLGLVVSSEGEHSSARLLEEESLELFQRAGDTHGIALATLCLAFIMTKLHEVEISQVLLQESAQLSREIGDRWNLALTLGNQGRLAKASGDYAESCALLAQSIYLWGSWAQSMRSSGCSTNWGNGLTSEATFDGLRSCSAQLRRCRRTSESTPRMRLTRPPWTACDQSSEKTTSRRCGRRDGRRRSLRFSICPIPRNNGPPRHVTALWAQKAQLPGCDRPDRRSGCVPSGIDRVLVRACGAPRAPGR